jgi:hypothetical protein
MHGFRTTFLAVHHMTKYKIGAREAVSDIRSGMSDADLMEKYGLSEKGLQMLFGKLVEAKLLDEAFLQKRSAEGIHAEDESSEAPQSAPPRVAGRDTQASVDSLAVIAAEIKEGVHDAEIMRRHEISPGRLGDIKAKLVESGRIQSQRVSAVDRNLTKTCQFCSQQIKESFSRCPHCGQWLEPEAPFQADEPLPSVTGSRPAMASSRNEDVFDDDKDCPWEDRESYGTLNAYFQTATRCLLTPSEFFSKLPLSGGYFNPILFAAMTGVVAFVLVYLFVQLFSRSGIGLLGLVLGVSFVFVGSVIFVPIGIGIWSAILHACLSLLGGAHSGYQATFRVVSYSSVTGIFNAIPFVGSLASLWGLVLTVIGLRETHKTSTGTAVAALLIPVGVIILLAVFAVTLAGLKLASHVSKGFLQSKPAKTITSQDYSNWALPSQVCTAVEEYIASVDAAKDLDAETAQAKVNQALQDLDLALTPYQNISQIPEIKHKARAYGFGLLTKGRLKGALGVNLEALKPAWDRMKDDLREMCANR